MGGWGYNRGSQSGRFSVDSHLRFSVDSEKIESPKNRAKVQNRDFRKATLEQLHALRIADFAFSSPDVLRI